MHVRTPRFKKKATTSPETLLSLVIVSPRVVACLKRVFLLLFSMC